MRKYAKNLRLRLLIEIQVLFAAAIAVLTPRCCFRHRVRHQVEQQDTSLDTSGVACGYTTPEMFIPHREIYGSADQRRVLARGEDLLALVGNDPRFCSHGRGVQLSDFDAGGTTLALLLRLTRLQGVSGCEMVPDADAPALIAALEDAGMKTDCYVNYMAGPDCVAIARDTVKGCGLPADLTLQTIDGSAPPTLLDAFASVALAQDVLPSVGSVMRGITRPGFGMVAFDAENRPVATAAASLARHTAHPDADMAQWGQLATRDDRKGQGIARAMACLSLVYGWENIGMRRFSTGIRAGNVASENLCRSLGLTPSGFTIVIAIDPDSFAGDQATK